MWRVLGCEIMEHKRRKRPRLHGFDYSSENYYFVTICTNNRECIFGEINRLNDFAEIAENELLAIPERHLGIEILNYVIMPNHIHFVLSIGCNPYRNSVGNGLDHSENCSAERSRPFPTLSQIVGLYKSGVSRLIHQTEPYIVVFQKSFHDRIIRSDDEYQKIALYIEQNPQKWQEDSLYTNLYKPKGT